MSIVTVSAKGRVPPDEVWERYANLSRWTEWAPQLTRVDALDERLTYGNSGKVFGPLWTSASFTITEVDEQAGRWSWTVTRWPISVDLDHLVAPRGGGSMTSLRLDGPLPVVLAYAPIARIALQLLVSKAPPSQQTPDKDAAGNLRE